MKHQIWDLLKRLIDVGFGLAVGLMMSADIIYARQIDMSKAGVSLKIFLAVGVLIILLQAIPMFLLATLFLYERLSKKKKETDESRDLEDNRNLVKENS